MSTYSDLTVPLFDSFLSFRERERERDHGHIIVAKGKESGIYTNGKNGFLSLFFKKFSTMFLF